MSARAHERAADLGALSRQPAAPAHSASAPDDRFADLPVGSLRRIHLGMIDAVLAGGGVAPAASLAARELRGTVAIVLPAADVAVSEPPLPERRAAALDRYVADRLLGRPATVPARLVAEVPVRSGDETLGFVALLDAPAAREAPEVLELAALAALTAVTLRDASVTQRRASALLLDDMRGGRLTGTELVVRAQRLGTDLSTGATALSARPPEGHIDRVLTVIGQELPGALAAARGAAVEALAPGGEAAVLRLVRRLNETMPAALAPFEPDPDRLGAALQTAELALALRGEAAPEALLAGSWRLLLASAPAHVHALVASTIGSIAAHDDLVATLAAYLERGGNMNATAAAVYAHRHTVSNRLERIRTLTGHDPQTPAGQTQLALGLQALAVERARASG